MSESTRAIVEYFQKFPDLGVEITDFESMKNCIAPIAIFQYFHGDQINLTTIKNAAEKNDWFSTFKEIRSMCSELEKNLTKSPYAEKKIDTTAIARRGDLAALEELMKHLVFYSFISKKEEALGAVQQLSKDTQNIIKQIIKPSQSPSTPTTPTKQESTPSTPKSTENNLDELKSKLDSLKNSNEKLKSENENLKNEINTIKSQANSASEEDEQKTMQKIAAVKAEIFVLQESKKTKNGRRQQLIDLKNFIPSLQENVEKAKNELKEMQSKIDGIENKGPDYTILHDRIQELRVDPKTKESNEILEEAKQLKRKLKSLNSKKDLLQAKLDGQQGIAVLEDRKRFLQQLEVTNQQRKQRAQLYLALAQKRMRTDAFIQEMRSFI